MKQLLFLLAFAGFFAAFTNGPAGYVVGDKATDFKLKNVDGKTYSLADIKDVKGYVVIFTCNACPYAQGYEQRIIDLHNKYASQGYPVVAINPNDPAVQPGDSFEKMQERSKDKKYPFLYLFDEKQEIYPQFGATRTPHVFLLDKDMVVKYIGAIDDSPEDASSAETKYLENAIEALKAGKNPEPAMTKSIGCGIKKKKS